MRERDRWESEWVRERGRLVERERERERKTRRVGKEKSLKNRCAKNCSMPTMNVNTL